MSQAQLYVNPIFLPQLKAAGFLTNIEVRVGVIGGRLGGDDLTLFSPNHWGLFAPRFTIYAFEPDEKACVEALQFLKSKKLTWPIKFFTAALWNEKGQKTLHITGDASASSLFPPSANFLARMQNVDFLKPAGTETVTVTTLDDLFLPTKLTLDFLQIDVQGGELRVLEGGTGVLDRGVLGVLSEVCYSEIYEGQPLFGDLAVFMHRQGFRSMHVLTTTADPRRDIPITGPRIRGVPTWGNVVFFRDLIREDPTFQCYTPEQFVKLAGLADLLGAYDQALELLVHVTRFASPDLKLNFADLIFDFLLNHLKRPSEEILRLPMIQSLRPHFKSREVPELPTHSMQYMVSAQIHTPGTATVPRHASQG